MTRNSPGFVMRVGRAMRGAAVLALALAWTTTVRSADLATAQKNFLDGDYAGVIKVARSALREAPGSGDWAQVLVQALLETGQNAEADETMKAALDRDAASVRLRWLARDVAFANGRPEEAKERVDEIRRLLTARMWMYRNPTDLVIVGRVALLLGSDPKDVLDKVYGTAQKADPKLRDVYLARGELALEKHDFVLAAKAYEEGLKVLPDDPDLLCGRAKAYAGGDTSVATEALTAALKRNSHHVPSLLQVIDHAIDAESYVKAEEGIKAVLEVNPIDPEAWAYRAVLAHLKNDATGEAAAREKALSSWAQNPRVDFLIGQKLAAKYRFAEAAVYQRRAHAFDPMYLPAMAELAQCLLRLGQEAEGWTLAQTVHERDEYDVEAFNLVALRDNMAKYAALTSDDFVLRMSPTEVSIYGARVLDLLRRARATLTEKYGAQLDNPTYVEVFSDQKDFAVRTFGLPDIPGFLGVCFGRVVTANSPATSAHPTNWESVLWHEFCHVITLQLTKNKMPRWLSEGISVYEERQVNPAWGMRLNPTYRTMIVKGDLVPVGKLSAAFLEPKTPQHLQFAYLESSLVVEYIVDKFGINALRGVLRDLRGGLEINAALAKNTAPLEQLEKDFDKYAHGLADNLAPKLDWERPPTDALVGNAGLELMAWDKLHPDNYWALKYRAGRAAEAKNWKEARQILEHLVALYPNEKGTDTAYRPLVAALKALGDSAAERAVLKQWAAVDDEAPDAYLRLMEFAEMDRDWAALKENVQRYLAVNPLVAPPYRYLAEASGATGDDSNAVVAWRTLLQLDAADPADAHFQLAQLLHRRGENVEAKRHALLALEDAPRYREALRLLVELKHGDPTPAAAPSENGAPELPPAPPLPPKTSQP